MLCNKKVWFESATDLQSVVSRLLIVTGSTARQLRQNVGGYNTALLTASVITRWVAGGPAPSAFNPTKTMQGRMYHYMGAMLPATEREPAFLSLHNHDPDFDKQCRASLEGVQRLNPTVLAELTVMLHQVNP